MQLFDLYETLIFWRGEHCSDFLRENYGSQTWWALYNLLQSEYGALYFSIETENGQDPHCLVRLRMPDTCTSLPGARTGVLPVADQQTVEASIRAMYELVSR